MRYSQLIDRTARRLQAADLHFGHGAGNAVDEAWFLVAAAATVEPAVLPVTQQVPEPVLQAARTTLQARIHSRRPLAQLTGTVSFYGLPLAVSNQVLVPRSPIGELLLNRLHPWLIRSPRRIADIGTGSGSLAIAAALAFENARVDALDVSAEALGLARENVARHGLADRVHVQSSDGTASCAGRRYDLILSNPPYVPWQEYLGLPPEYHREPRLALVSPDEGLAFTRHLLREAGRHLRGDGLLVVEVGNSMFTLLERWPDFPADWPDFELGGGGVFIIAARDLAAWRHRHPAI